MAAGSKAGETVIHRQNGTDIPGRAKAANARDMTRALSDRKEVRNRCLASITQAAIV